MDVRLQRGAHYDPAEAAGRSQLVAGVTAGVLGGLALAAPIVIWDWSRTGHRALELPMAATAWPFGLDHFSHTDNLWWPIVIGTALLAGYWALSGLVFALLADRPLRFAGPGSTLALGAAWSVVTFLVFWEMVLPIARDGMPFRASPRAPLLFTAPNWVWILGFVLSGLVVATGYKALRHLPAAERAQGSADRADDRTGLVPAA